MRVPLAAALVIAAAVGSCTADHREEIRLGAASPSPPAASVPASPLPASPTVPAVPEPVAVHGPFTHALGSARAPVVMVEFTDYECPFCRRYRVEAYPLLKARYVDTGKVRYVVRDLPLDIHPFAATAAEVARCADAQGRFWPMRDALYDNRELLNPERIARLAEEVGVAAGPLQACLDGHLFAAAVKADVAEAHAAGLDRTPSFVIGREEGGTVRGVRVVGAQGAATFAARIDEALRGR